MTSLKFIPLTFFAFLILTNSYGQNRENKSFKLSRIKKVFHEINNYKNYKIVTIDDSEEFLGHGTDNGGSLKGYYKGDSLKKIVEWVGLSNRVVQNEYYFDKGKFVFVYSTDKQYKFDYNKGEFDYSKFEKTITGRYYFSNDKLIDAIVSGNIHEKIKEQDGADFLSSSKEYVNLLNKKINRS